MKSHRTSLAVVLLLCGVAWGADPDAATLFRQAETAYKQQNYAQALSLLRTMQEKYPDSKHAVRGWEYIAQCENALGDPMAAFEAYQKIWDRHKDFAQLATITRNQMKIGNYFLKNKEYKNAITVYEKILENAPHSDVAAGAQYSLAQAYLGSEDYGAARAELAKLIRNYPSSQLVDDAMFDLGYVAYLQAKDAPYDQGATSEAISAFRTFISNFPSSPKVAEAQQHIRTLRSRKAAALFRTAEFYENVRVPKAAQITYREVIEQYPDTTYADEARRRLEGAERRPVSEVPALGRQASALYDDTQAARMRDAAGASRPPSVSTMQVTPVTVRPSADAQRMTAQARAAETMRQASAQRVAQLKNDPEGREALRAAMREAYMEEIKRARATKAVWRSQQVRARTAARTPGPEPLPPPAQSSAPRTTQPAAQPAGPPSLSAPLVASTDDEEFAFEVRSDDVRIDIAPEPAVPSEPTPPARPAPPRRATPRMIIETDGAAERRDEPAAASAFAPAPPPPPATPIDGPSFDDVLAGRVQDDAAAAPVIPASDWQPFAAQTPTTAQPVMSPRLADSGSDFIVIGSEPLEAPSAPAAPAQTTRAATVPKEPEMWSAATAPVPQRTPVLGAGNADFIVVKDEELLEAPSAPAAPAQTTRAAPVPKEPEMWSAATAPVPQRTPVPGAGNADFIVVKDEELSAARAPAAALVTQQPRPARTLLSDMTLERDKHATRSANTATAAEPPSVATARPRPRNAIAPPGAAESAAPAEQERTVFSTRPSRSAQPAEGARAGTAQHTTVPAAEEPSASPDIERARMEEQARAAVTRRRVEAVREQAAREERTVRQISPDGRVRRAQYDAPTAAASDTSYNVDELQRDYAGIYYLIKRGDAALQQGLHSEAKQNYGNALDRLLKLKERAPTWQADIVNYRIDYCRERMRSAQ